MIKAELINLPKFLDERGNLSFIEEFKQLPFKIKRSYWIYDVPGGEERGEHAYRENEEFIIALSGSFDVVLNDSITERRFNLNRSYYGLYVSRMLWRKMDNFSTNSLALVLSSTEFDENDYIRDFDRFKKEIEAYIKNSIDREQIQKQTLVFTEHENFIKNTVYECSIIELDKRHRVKGNITVVENNKTVPFDVKRVYYLYDIPGGESRGGHAHKELRQLIVAASGSFDVILDDGNVKRTFTLNRPHQGLLVVPGIWRELDNFSSGSVCLVLASLGYDEDDYIRDYDEFKKCKSI